MICETVAILRDNGIIIIKLYIVWYSTIYKRLILCLKPNGFTSLQLFFGQQTKLPICTRLNQTKKKFNKQSSHNHRKQATKINITTQI